MSSFSISNITSDGCKITASGLTAGNSIRFFVRLTSDTSNVSFDESVEAFSSTLACNVTGLRYPSTSYTVNVHDGTAWIGAQTFTTAADTSAVPTPSVTVSSYTDTTVTISFSNLQSGTKYYVSIKDMGTLQFAVDTSFTATASTATKTYSGLDPDTYYEIAVVADDISNVVYKYFTTEAAVSWSLSSTSLGTLSDAYSVSYSFGSYVLRRFTVKFANSGTATFYSTGNADTLGYLGTTTGYDEETGEPTSCLTKDDDSGSSNNFSFTYDVVAGTTYYLWVRLYDGEETGTAYVCIDPPVITWSLSSSALGTLSEAYSASYSFGEYVLRRYSMKFEVSGTATFYTTGSADTIGYLGTTTGYDDEAGVPTSYLAKDDDSGTGNNFSIAYDVEAGITYYLWVRLYDGENTGAAYVCIDVPEIKKCYIFNGSEWVLAMPYIYDGSAWVPAPPSIYNSGWQ